MPHTPFLLVIGNQWDDYPLEPYIDVRDWSLYRQTANQQRHVVNYQATYQMQAINGMTCEPLMPTDQDLFCMVYLQQQIMPGAYDVVRKAIEAAMIAQVSGTTEKIEI